MKRNYTLYLNDICQSIEKIERFVEGYIILLLIS